MPDKGLYVNAMKRLGLTLCGMIMLLSGCALQRDIVILEDRLITLEQQNQHLQSQNEKMQKQIQMELESYNKSSQTSETKLRSQYAGMNANLDSVQTELQAMSGRIDEIDYAVKRKIGDVDASAKRLDELSLAVAKLDQRMNQIEQYLNFEKNGKPPAGEAGNAAAPKQESADSDKQLYDNAKKAYDNGQLDSARQGFAQLIKSYPKSANADNAQFWIGETYYREKWYEKAILEYQTVIEKYPKGNKVPAAMLKQGMAFLKLGDKSNARLIFKELAKKYPSTNEARIANQKLKEF